MSRAVFSSPGPITRARVSRTTNLIGMPYALLISSSWASSGLRSAAFENRSTRHGITTRGGSVSGL